MIKAIALDLDGTLLNNKKQIPGQTLETMDRLSNSGFLIIIATGRPLRTVQKVVPDWFSKFYWITSNGAWISKDNKVIRKLEINHEETNEIIRILTCNGLNVHIEANDQFFSDTKLRTDIIDYSYKPLNEFQGDACMILAYLEDKNNAITIKSLLPSFVSMTLTNNNSMINIGRNGCEKSNSVLWVLKNENLNFENLIAFGDDINDMQLISCARIGVAVNNAIIDLKEVASFITKSNEDEGVGFILNELLMNNDVESLIAKYT
ncbi:MAG: HAD-IIB family hydrolase [Candidatus Thorarchaeota archaeon]|jgi:Cof subfamily protein (haloacid dehalogenase superfamily)